MRKLLVISALLLIPLLAACSPAIEATPTAPVISTQPANTTLEPPSATIEPDDYPPPSPPPTLELPQAYQDLDFTSAYPGTEDASLVWVLRPLGQQCTDASTYEYATVDEAVSALTDAGVEVYESETVSLGVCESCDCPTSEHFRVQIDAGGLATAQAMGWEPESNP